MASVHPSCSPQSALVGIAVTRNLDLIFDTLKSSRKYRNLVQNPEIAFVIGWENEQTVQYEGLARELSEADKKYRTTYFEKFPEGVSRAKSKDVTHFTVTPTWIRYSDYSLKPEYIQEWEFNK